MRRQFDVTGRRICLIRFFAFLLCCGAAAAQTRRSDYDPIRISRIDARMFVKTQSFQR